jgi:hypothetical protein
LVKDFWALLVNPSTGGCDISKGDAVGGGRTAAAAWCSRFFVAVRVTAETLGSAERRMAFETFRMTFGIRVTMSLITTFNLRDAY